MAPGGLGSEPPNGNIDVVEPFASKTLEFDLFPLVLEKGSAEEIEKVVVLEEQEPEPDIEMNEDEEDWNEVPVEDEEEEVVEDDTGLDLDLDDEMPEMPEGPRDFTPVEEEYNLISMVPPKYPENVEKRLKKKRRKF